MPRSRSVLIIALIWMAALAASSVPDGLGGAARASAASAGDALPGGAVDGKRWAVVVDPAGKRWDGSEDLAGKRWS